MWSKLREFYTRAHFKSSGFSLIELMLSVVTISVSVMAFNQIGLNTVKTVRTGKEIQSFAMLTYELKSFLGIDDASSGCSAALAGQVYTDPLVFNNVSKGMLAQTLQVGSKIDNLVIEALNIEVSDYAGPRPELVYGELVLRATSSNPLMVFSRDKAVRIPLTLAINTTNNEINHCSTTRTRLAQCLDMFANTENCTAGFFPNDMTVINDFLNSQVCTLFGVDVSYCAWGGSAEADAANDAALSYYSNY